MTKDIYVSRDLAKGSFCDVILTSHSDSLKISMKKRWVDKRYSPHCRKCPLFRVLQKNGQFLQYGLYLRTQCFCMYLLNKRLLRDSIRYIYINIFIDTIHYTYYINLNRCADNIVLCFLTASFAIAVLRTWKSPFFEVQFAS